MACTLDANGLGPATTGCRVALPTVDGSRLLSFQLIQTDTNCGAVVPVSNATAFTYLTFYDADGALLGSVSYPTLATAYADTGGVTESPRWYGADGAAGAKAQFSGTVGAWAEREAAYWTWTPAAAGTCDVVTSTASAQGVLHIAADGTLSMAPGNSSVAVAALGSGSAATMVFAAGALADAAAVEFGAYSGAPEYTVTFAAPTTAFPAAAAVPPPWFAVVVLVVVAVAMAVLGGALAVSVRGGRRAGAAELGAVVAQAKAAGATTIVLN